MKPFDLEAAKRGDPICVETTGAKVHFLAVDPQTANLWARVEGEQMPRCWTRAGQEMGMGEIAAPWALPPRRLLMAPKKRTVWVNVHAGPAQDAFWHDTQAQADTNAYSERIGGKAWPLEIEE